MNRTVPPIGRDPGRFGRFQAACAWLRSKAGKMPALRFGSWAPCVFCKTRKVPMNHGLNVERWTLSVAS